MRRFQAGVATVALGALLLAPRGAAAQGYGVYEHGTCAMGRAGAGVADPCDDGSAIFFNPAGLAAPGLDLTGRQTISGGVTFIAPRGGFVDGITGERMNLKPRFYPVPHLFFTTGLTDRIAAGIGVFAPYGLATEWPSASIGRFLGYKSEVQGLYVQPTVAARLTDRLSVGGGFDLSIVKVGLRQRVDLFEQEAIPGVYFGNLGVPAGTDFADINLEGHTTGTGFHLGTIFKATDWLSFGARYLSRQEITVDDGDADFTQIPTGLVLAPNNPLGLPGGTPVDAVLAAQFADGGPLADQGGATSLTFPDQLVLGLALRVTPTLQLFFDYQWVNWSVFDELRIDFENQPDDVVIREDYEDTSGFRLAAEYAFSPVTNIRAGFLKHAGAAPDQTVTPNLPEGPRDEFTVGFGSKLSQRLGFDFAYQFIDQGNRQGRVRGPLPGEEPTTALNTGVYTFSAHLFGLTLTYEF